MERVGNRVDGLVRAVARSRRGTGVVLVAHGEVLAAYLGHIQGTSAPKRDPKGLRNGSITVVDVAPTGAPTIRLENHLPAVP
jgi:broad specificity phosphatase PhoE